MNDRQRVRAAILVVTFWVGVVFTRLMCYEYRRYYDAILLRYPISLRGYIDLRFTDTVYFQATLWCWMLFVGSAIVMLWVTAPKPAVEEMPRTEPP